MMPSASVDLEERWVREIGEGVALGGAGWRPHAASLCAEAVGGDASRFLGCLARLEARLGSPVAEQPLFDEDLPAAAKVEIRRFYSGAVGAPSAARAVNLRCDDELARETARTGIGQELEARVLALYRLEAALPAGLLARVGAILGGGKAPLIEGLGGYFEAAGLAFRIMADVLELRGFEAGVRDGGGAIRQGQLTLPIAKGLGMLAPSRRQWLRQTLEAPPQDELVVRRAVYELEDIGAFSACTQLARGLVDGAWRGLEPMLQESRSKAKLRAFGHYVLDWHQPSTPARRVGSRFGQRTAT